MESKSVSTQSKEFWSCNGLQMSVGTNCPQGGDAGHGGKTVLELTDLASTGWRVAVRSKGEKAAVIDQPDSIQIEFYGDTECETLIESLEYALTVLKAQYEK